MHVFAHAGHLSFITHTQEFVSTVGGFLATTKKNMAPKPV